MKNLDARTAMLAQSASVRVDSGRDSAAGGAPVDAFETIFRRMKDQVAPASPAPADSQALRVPDQTRGHSPPTAREETSSLMRFPVRSNIPGLIEGRDPVAAQDARASGQIALARDAAADMAIRMVDTGSAGETLDAPPDAVFPPASSAVAMSIPLAREAALDSLVASAEQPVSGAIAAEQPVSGAIAAEQPVSGAIAAEQPVSGTIAAEQPVSGTIAAEQPVSGTIANISVDNPPTGIATTLEGQAQFALSAPEGVKLIMLPAKAQDTAAPGDTATRFIPVMSQGQGISAEEAVAAPYVVPTHFSTSASAFETLVAGGGALLDRPEEAAGIAGEPLVDAVDGGAISQLTLSSRAERVVPQVTGGERVQLLDQVVQVVRVVQHGESTEIIVQLKPESLGRLSIRVLADDQGMRVEIRAENEAVRQVLADNLADLQQRLSEKGLTFDQFNLFAELGSHSRRESDRSLDAPPADTKAAEEDSREAVSVETASLAPSSVIDYFA